jgi:iron complex transport system ATP-binding protein
MTLATKAEARLHAEGLTLAYDGRTVAEDLGVVIPDRSFTVIVGPNACGKTLLPRRSIGLDGITVADLVARGRYPHQWPLRQRSKKDSAVVGESMRSTGVDDLGQRLVDELSGG